MPTETEYKIAYYMKVQKFAFSAYYHIKLHSEDNARTLLEEKTLVYKQAS